jgi:hypothetical protein
MLEYHLSLSRYVELTNMDMLNLQTWTWNL